MSSNFQRTAIIIFFSFRPSGSNWFRENITICYVFPLIILKLHRLATDSIRFPSSSFFHSLLFYDRARASKELNSWVCTITYRISDFFLSLQMRQVTHTLFWNWESNGIFFHFPGFNSYLFFFVNCLRIKPLENQKTPFYPLSRGDLLQQVDTHGFFFFFLNDSRTIAQRARLETLQSINAGSRSTIFTIYLLIFYKTKWEKNKNK